MAEARRNWRTWFAIAALSLGASGLARAQASSITPAPEHSVEIQAPPSGALSGWLTDLHSVPLAGVSVVLRNLTTGAELHAVTAKNGAFRFTRLDAGEYSLTADAPRLGHGQLDGILVTGGAEARVQAAMRFEPAAPGLLEATAPSEIPVPPLETAAAPRPASSTPAKAFAAAEASRPPAALPLPAASRAALSRSAPKAIAAASTGPLPTSTTLRATETIQPRIPPSVSQPPAPLAAAARAEATIPRAAPPSPQLRAEIETQSLPVAPALALTLPRTLPLTFSTVPALPFSAAVASGLNAALLLGRSTFSPVASAAQKTDPAAAAATTTMTAAQLQSLPAAGRRWQEFLADTPAANAGADSSQQSYRGSQESADIVIDGSDTSLRFGIGAGSAAGSTFQERAIQSNDRQSTMGQSWSGGRGLGVSEAAIREVTATAGNVEAEGMRSAGGRTGIETERGGNALHGQGFLYDRQNVWGAQNPFTQWVTETAPAGELGLLPTVPVFDNGPAGPPESYTPPDHEMVWGLGMGSSIRRDKLFWFGALDSYHRNDPGLAMVKYPYLQVPTDCGTPPCAPTTTGFFVQPSNCQMQLLGAQMGLTGGGQSTTSNGCVSGLNEALVAYSNMLGQLASLLGPAPRTAAQWMGFGRVDWQAAERHHFTLEGIGADWNAPGGGMTGVSANYGNRSFGSSHASEQWLLARWEAFLTPNLLAVTQASEGRTILTARPKTPSAFEQTFLSGNSYGQLPEIVVDSTYGFAIGNPSRFGNGSYPDEKLYHAQEMLDWVHNRLLVKAGFEMDRNSDATSLLRNQTGTYHYSTVASFISDALSFEKYGLSDALDPANPHNCGATDTTFGSQPCYSSYSQTMGPTNWHLSTNDWAGYATAQWQAGKFAVFSAGLRWELEQLPPPIANLDNPQLPFTEKLPGLGNNWGPRVGVAMGSGKGRWPVLRLGYGMYYGRVANSTIETALTQTGSLNGDLNFFLRPQDDCQYCAGGAPPFPHVLTGDPGSVVTPGAIGFAPSFRNPEAHQAVASVEQPLPDHLELTASAMLSLGRRLPVYIDTNFDPAVNPQTITYAVCDEVTETASGAGSNGQPSNSNGPCGNLGMGPIKASTITVPFYASWPAGDCPGNAPLNLAGQCGWNNPNYQEIDQITSKANSTYEGAMVKLTRYGHRGLSLFAHYTYSHTMDWNPNESPLDPAADFREEYGTSDQDVRHSAAVMAIFEPPWKLHNLAGKLGNGWMLSGIGEFHSGLPYTMRVTGSLPEEFATSSATTSSATIVGLRPGMNGSGGDNRVYGLGSDNQVYNIGRNTYRYPNTWKADMRLGKKFNLGEMRELEILAETFNLFNHQNVTEIETTGYTIESGTPPSEIGAPGTSPTLNFLTGLKTSSRTGPIPGFGQPLNINGSDFYSERQIQFGLRMRF